MLNSDAEGCYHVRKLSENGSLYNSFFCSAWKKRTLLCSDHFFNSASSGTVRAKYNRSEGKKKIPDFFFELWFSPQVCS
ncbi:MAG: hypothetical protein D3908_00895 [Candidatus Electrothrix sp. AUS4]|nr:hypothetical protein [Candidatus Electrothrix sp. AUS4]